MHARRFVLAALFAAVAAVLTGSLIGAQAEALGVDVRLAAKMSPDGSVEVGLQHHYGGQWQTVLPDRRILAADTPVEVWHVSDAAGVPVRQAEVRIAPTNASWTWNDGPGQFRVQIDGRQYWTNCGALELQLSDDGLRLRTYDSNCEQVIEFGQNALSAPSGRGEQDVRVAARRLENGRIELGLQRHVDGAWQTLERSAASTLPTELPGRWYVTTSLRLPPRLPDVTIDLRRGAEVVSTGGQFVLGLDGVEHRTNCGWLSLETSHDAIVVDTLDEHCVQSVDLATVCAAADVGADCDEQRNLLYQWEWRQALAASVHDIRLTLAEAQTIANAIFRDYYPTWPRPPTVVASRDGRSYYEGRTRRIHLTVEGQSLLSVVHEVGHALVHTAALRDAGHGDQFAALVLELWERYVPVIDIAGALTDAASIGLEVAAVARPSPRSDDGIREVQSTLCAEPVRPVALCRALAGEVTAIPDAVADGRFVGWGSRGDDLWWGAYQDEETGLLRSYVVREVAVSGLTDGRARLQIGCNGSDELEVGVWWSQLPSVPSSLQYRIGLLAWRDARWSVPSGGRWGDDFVALHDAPDPVTTLQALSWASLSDLPFSIRFVHNGRRYSAEFDLRGMFDTPVQPNLAQCGADKPQDDPDAPIIEWGRFGEHFFWGVDEDQEPLQTYVVRDAAINGSAREARLSVQCEARGLEVDVYWEVDRDLDWTILYRINDGTVQSEEWASGWGAWGDTEYKWTGREDASDLVAQLAWAAQAGGTFTVQAHERENPGQIYTATFDLDGLFNTAVQPNLARCGR